MNVQVGGLTITTRPLADPTTLLSWLPSDRGVLGWVRDGEGLVGWGEAARFSTGGPARFSAARDWWSTFLESVEIRDELAVSGSGPVAFVSMAFADTSDSSVLIVPKVLLGRRDGFSWTTVVEGEAPARQEIRPPRGLRYRPGAVSDGQHRAAVAAARSRIRAGELDKVVLARDLVAQADEPFDERYLLTRLAERYPTCWAYAVAGLIGATPEMLLWRRGNTVGSRLLAGTVWPRPEVSGGTELARDLLSSGKNREEHEFGVRSLEATLAPYCSSMEVPAEPSVVHLANVSHLATDVVGTLAEDTPLLELAGAVHPTAAACGTPSTAAQRVIDQLEGMDRRGYLGPVGWLDAAGNGELGVALRCALLDGRTARLFAGGGIVSESDPDTEADEVQAKFDAVRSALEA